MDQIQKILIQAGRKDLAQEYYKKIAYKLSFEFPTYSLRDEFLSKLDNAKIEYDWDETSKNFEVFIRNSSDFIKADEINSKVQRRKTRKKLTYDEKFMRSRGLKSWRGPNPSNH